MKHTVRLLALTLLLSLIPTSYAQQAPYDIWVGAFGEYYSPDSDKPEGFGYLDDGYGIGLEAGFRFTPHWAVRLDYSHLKLDANRVGDSSESGDKVGLDAMYFLNKDLLYVFTGYKHETLDDGYNLANLGVGKHWNLKKNWKIISEVAAYHDFGEGFRDYSLKVGIAYIIGPDIIRPSKDSDKDGVKDSLDQCPGTPEGRVVDGMGCELDADGDGIKDGDDMCPGTITGTAVNSHGCPLDDDMDGVINIADACPNTPRDTSVDIKGCPLVIDSDGDGVSDKDDVCPSTPASDKVDAKGCSIFTDKEVGFTLKVEFGNNSSDISNPGDAQFKQFADFMARFPNTRATIEGHSSAPGAADYNLMLSQKRADAVKALLVSSYAVASSRLTAIGYGETRLLDTSNTQAAHQKNRRIEIKVTALEQVKLEK